MFNGAKIPFLVFPVAGYNNPKKCLVFINNTAVWNVDKAIYFGHHIPTNDWNGMVLAAHAQFWRRLNISKAEFGNIKSSLQCTLISNIAVVSMGHIYGN